jgi:cell division protein FtsB
MYKERAELIGAPKKRIAVTIVRYFLFVALLVALAVHVGLLLFGPNSVEVLFELRKQQRTLERNIESLKKENAKLQKLYFELRELQAQE